MNTIIETLDRPAPGVLKGLAVKQKPAPATTRAPYIGRSKKIIDVYYFAGAGVCRAQYEQFKAVLDGNGSNVNLIPTVTEPINGESIWQRAMHCAEYVQEERAIIIGHSLGAHVASIAAKTYVNKKFAGIFFAPAAPRQFMLPFMGYRSRFCKPQYLRLLWSTDLITLHKDDVKFLADGSDVTIGPESGKILRELTNYEVTPLKEVMGEENVHVFTPTEDRCIPYLTHGMEIAMYHSEHCHKIPGGHFAHMDPKNAVW